jgi:hypothetical protein
MYFDLLRWKMRRLRPAWFDAAITDGRPAQYDPARPLAFMHVPKTAGTALIGACWSALRPVRILGGFDGATFGGFQDFASMDAAIRRQIFDSASAIPAGGRFVAGHMALSSLRDSYPSAQFITVLREPISRVLSHWLFWRQHDDDSLVAWGTWADRIRRAREPLARFLTTRDVACQIDNVTLRMLLWPHRFIPSDDFIDPRHDELLFAEAAEALSRFDFVDIIESPGFQDQLQRWLGRPAPCGRVNETRVPPPAFRTALAHEMTSEAGMLLEQRARLDLRLWTLIGRRGLPDDGLAALRGQTLRASAARFARIAAGINPAA